jgi:hypothetical protein
LIGKVLDDGPQLGLCFRIALALQIEAGHLEAMIDLFGVDAFGDETVDDLGRDRSGGDALIPDVLVAFELGPLGSDFGDLLNDHHLSLVGHDGELAAAMLVEGADLDHAANIRHPRAGARRALGNEELLDDLAVVGLARFFDQTLGDEGTAQVVVAHEDEAGSGVVALHLARIFRQRGDGDEFAGKHTAIFEHDLGCGGWARGTADRGRAKHCKADSRRLLRVRHACYLRSLASRPPRRLRTPEWTPAPEPTGTIVGY